MSAEALTPQGAMEFSARPKVETRRGTEVESQTGNRIVDAANRIAAFMDRLKGGRTELVETSQDVYEQGRDLLKATGETAIATAVKVGNVVGGVALIGVEVGVGATVIAGKAIERKAHEVGAKVDEIGGYIKEGVGGGIDYAIAKKDALVAGANEVAGYAVEGILGGVDYAKQKGTELRESAVDKYEAVRGLFRDRAETAKQNLQKLRRGWIARYSQGRRGVINTVESGKAYAKETGENIKHNGKVLRRTGQLAMSHYRANSVPVMPR